MKKRLLIAFFGNLIDTASTIILYHGYGYTEANPIMAQLIQHPVLFTAVKMVAMTVVLVWLWRNKDSKYAKIASWVTAVTYGAIAIYYCIFFGVLL